MRRHFNWRRQVKNIPELETPVGVAGNRVQKNHPVIWVIILIIIN
jgi:hypothetical protein